MSKSLKIAFGSIFGFFVLLWVGIAYTLTLAFSRFEPVIDPDYSIKKGRSAAFDRNETAWQVRSPLFAQDQVERGELAFAFRLAPQAPERTAPAKETDRANNTTTANKTAPGAPALADDTRIEVRLARPATLRGSSDWALGVRDGSRAADGSYQYEIRMPIAAPGFWEIEIRLKSGDGRPLGFAQHRVYAR